MAKDPAFLFYSSDFLTGVSDLTFEERGQYITLLCLQHQKGRLSKKAVAIAVASASDDVMNKFMVDDNGLYYNERLEMEAHKRAEHSRKQRDRAINGWKKRRQNQQATADATALPLEDEDDNTLLTIKDKVKKINELFEMFKKEVKNGNHDAAIEQMYSRLKIKKGTLTPLIKLFNGQLIIEEKLHENTQKFKNHFNNWLNTQDMLGKLNEYKRQSQGQL